MSFIGVVESATLSAPTHHHHAVIDSAESDTHTGGISISRHSTRRRNEWNANEIPPPLPPPCTPNMQTTHHAKAIYRQTSPIQTKSCCISLPALPHIDPKPTPSKPVTILVTPRLIPATPGSRGTPIACPASTTSSAAVSGAGPFHHLKVLSFASPPSRTWSIPSSSTSASSSACSTSFQSPSSTFSLMSTCSTASHNVTPHSIGPAFEYLSPTSASPSSSSAATVRAAVNETLTGPLASPPCLSRRGSSIGSDLDPSDLERSASSCCTQSPAEFSASISPDDVSAPPTRITVTLLAVDDGSAVHRHAPAPAPASVMSPDSLTATHTISEEQEQHIASLVRKTKKRIAPLKPMTVELTHATPATAIAPASLTLPAIRPTGSIPTPSSSRLSAPLATTPRGCSLRSPSMALVNSPRNFNLFCLKLPSAGGKSPNSDGDAADDAAADEENGYLSFGSGSGEEDGQTSVTPGTEELDGSPEEDGKDAMVAVYGMKGISLSTDRDDTLPASAMSFSSSSSSLGSMISIPQSGSESDIAELASATPQITKHQQHEQQQQHVVGFIDDIGSAPGSVYPSPPSAIPVDSSAVGNSPAPVPAPSLAARRKLSRRATLSGLVDARLRSSPYDFDPSSGALQIDGWEISKQGVTRTPVPEARYRRMSISGPISCGNSPLQTAHRVDRQTESTPPIAITTSEPNLLTSTPMLIGRRLSLVRAAGQRDKSVDFSSRLASSIVGTPVLTPLSRSTSLQEDALSSFARHPHHHTCAQESLPSALTIEPILSECQLQSTFGSLFKLPQPATGLGIELKLTDLVRIGEIGRGVNGAVHKAVYLPTLSIVALKSVSIFDKDERHQFLQELRAFLNCTSPHMVRFIGACFSEGKITMALEYLNRGSLDHVIQRSGPLNEATLRIVAQQLLTGIRDLHAQAFLHRDVKPANFLIDNRGVAKVSDFGLLKQLQVNESTGVVMEDKKFVGTMIYLAPERIAGHAFSFPSDIYAVGLSIIYLATGELQSGPKDYWAMLQNTTSAPPPALPQFNPETGANNFSPHLRDLVDQMMRKDPTKRATADQLLSHPWFTEEASRNPTSPTDPLESWPCRELQQPDVDELATLVDAVLDRWYHPLSLTIDAHHLCEGALAYELTPTDTIRFAHLAQQLGWETESVIQEFKERIRERIDRAREENTDTFACTSISVDTSVSFSSSTSSFNSCFCSSSSSSHSSTPVSGSTFSFSCDPPSSACLTPIRGVMDQTGGFFTRSHNASPQQQQRTELNSPSTRPPKAPNRQTEFNSLTPSNNSCTHTGLDSDSTLGVASDPPRPFRRLSASGRRATFNARLFDVSPNPPSTSIGDSPPFLGMLRKLASANEAAAAITAASASGT